MAIDPDCLKSSSIKMRVGIKCIGFFFENEALMMRNQPFIDKINTKNCYNMKKMMEKSKEIKLWDAAKIVMDLSQFELNKLQILFEKFVNIFSVFTNEICSHLSQETHLEDIQLKNELLKVKDFLGEI